MDATTVLIEDDDVDMLEPVEVCDDNIDTGQKQNSSKSVDTIILDEDEEPSNHEAVTVNDDDSSPVAAKDEVVTSNDKDSSPADTNNKIAADNDKNSSFIGLLKNNTLLNKIVKRCLTMANNAGMSRVINKTLLPLYKDADNKFKESAQFTDVLNKILSNLKHDPNHKFLHIKSLCEELKAGKYRRKVPFITLTTDLRRTNGFVPGREQFTRMKRKKTIKDRDTNEKMRKTAIINLNDYNLRRKKRARNKNKKTAVINLDNSDDECVIDLDVDDDDDAVVVTNVDDGHDTVVASDEENDHDKSVADNDNNEDDEASNDDVMVVDDNSDSVSDLSNKENNIEENENNKLPTCLTDKTPDTLNSKVLSNNINKNTNTNISKDNDKIRNVATEEIATSKNNIETEHTSELLIPKRSVKPDRHSLELKRAIAIENQIAIYKDKITELEKEEVTNNNFCSPYILCDKYKKKIVELYKKLCKLTGHGDASVMKQRVVRLQVIDGHPPGPTRMLEQFLNSTIDETGNVPLPDFQDVVKCVFEADIADRLGWKKEQIMREAIALFTQCGHALRKSRQRREYKDLIHLVREVKQDDPEDYDPANDNPLLRAKLEENKLIAKANEDEIFDRFVRMERLPNSSQTVIPRVCNILRVTPGDGSDTDSELDLTPPNISRTTEIQHNHSANKEISNGKIDETAGVNSRPTENSNNLILPTLRTTLDKFVNFSSIQSANKEISNGKIDETAGVNSRLTESSNNLLPLALGTTLDKFVNVSTIQSAIDKIVTKVINSMSSNAKITSSQTILQLTQGNKTISTITPQPTKSTTEYPLNTTTQNAINFIADNLTNTRTPYRINAVTPNPIDTHIQNSLNTAQNITNNPFNITTQNKMITIAPNLTNTTTQNVLNPTLDNRTNNNTTQYTPFNAVTQNKTLTITPHFTNRTIQNPLYISQEYTLNNINNTTQYTTNSPNNVNNPIKKPETDTPTHISWSNTLQKVGRSNRYVVSFDSNTSQNNAKEKKNDHNVIETGTNSMSSENIEVKTKEDSIKKAPIDLNTHVTFDSNISRDNMKEKKDDHNITDADLNTPDSENVMVKTEEGNIKKEPMNSNRHCPILFDTESQDNAKDIKDHNITEVDSNIDNENVKLETEDRGEKEPIDISAVLNALGDNYLTTIFDIEDPFLAIEISSDSSSDDES